MKTFLAEVVEKLLRDTSHSLENQLLILPSQRACVFLKDELKKQLTTTTFLPRVISIENFIQEVTGIDQCDNVQLLFDFYTIYKELTPKDKTDSFDRFSQWATVVIQDFNEVDRHLINTDELFVYLRDINRLQNWSPDTEISKNYFAFFEKLATYYNALKEELLSTKQSYQGLIYRQAVDVIDFYLKSYTDKKFVLIGFNALNKAEETLFQRLLELPSTQIFWDVDASYFNDKSNLTGAFIRKYKEEWPYFKENPFMWVKNHLASQDKKIYVLGASKNVTQIKCVANILEAQGSLQNTALVLADENLLSTTLNSLPSSVNKINITMGYPLKNVPLTSLIKNVARIYLNQEKLGVKGEDKFYYKDVLKLLSHPYVKMSNDKVGALLKEIGKSNKIFISSKVIQNYLNDSWGTIFRNQGMSVTAFIDCLLQLFLDLKDKVSSLDREYIFRFYTIFNQLKSLNESYGYLEDLKILTQLFDQLVDQESLSFRGEPLEGLQLMGVLETRVIDFDTVIMTSVNEGVLPSSKSDQSFIPFDVKQAFGLPTYHEKDAIFSYHFYRLLHRAKKVYLLYNKETDAFGSGEQSRFLTQLLMNNPDVKSEVIVPDFKLEKPKEKVICKDAKLIETLKQMAVSGFSPSALSSYVYNPMDFYYQRVLRLEELDEVEETVAANTMGTIVHNVLENIYKPYIGTVITLDILKLLGKAYPKELIKQFDQVYNGGDYQHGTNRIIFEVCHRYIKRFLDQEKELVASGKELRIIELEQNMSATITIKGLDFPIKLKGIVDRVDEVDGVLRILDYKTGKVEQTQLNIADFEVVLEDYKYSKALQVMFYVFLYMKNKSIDFTRPIQGGIVSFKALNSGFMNVRFNKQMEINQEAMDNYLQALKQLILEIYDSNKPFVDKSEA